MKFRESLVAALREERRPSRRMALMAFVRRYSRGDVPVTSWRGTGDSADALMSLLAKCGLEDGGAVKLTRSSLDASAWRLAFTPGDTLAEEFINRCRDAGARDRRGDTPVDLAVRAMHAGGKDLPAEVERLFPPDGPEDAPAAPAAPSFADGVAKRPADILAAVAAMPARISVILSDDSVDTANNDAKDVAERALRAPAVPTVAPLSVIEAYVRYVMPEPDLVPYGGYVGAAPKFLMFPGTYQERLGAPAYVRPVMPGDPDIPLRALTSAPLGFFADASFTDRDPFGSSPVDGYLVESLSGVEPVETKDAKRLLVVGNAPIVDESIDAATRVEKALFVANSPLTFWDYVRWLYDCAYKGVARCRLTPHLRVGAIASGGRAFSLAGNAAYARLPVGDPGSMFPRGDAAVSDGLRSFYAAVFALVLADPSLADPEAGLGKAAALVHLPATNVVVGASPTPPAGGDEDMDSDSMYLGKADLPAEWFWLTHSTGVAPDGRSEDVDNWTASSTDSLQAATAAFRAFRRKAEESPNRTLLPRCSFTRSPLMLGRNVNGGVRFRPASAFYSGLIALIRSYMPDLAFREWNGRAPWSWAIHNPGAVLAAAYSGIETDLSPTMADGGVFPLMDWYPLDALRCILSPADASDEALRVASRRLGKVAARFTHNIEVMSAKGVSMAKMASRSKGTERTKVLVVETNVDAAAFCRGVTPQEASEFVARATELFVQTFGYRNDDVLCVADRTDGLADTRRAKPRYRDHLAAAIDRRWPSAAGADSEADFYRRGAPSGLSDGAWWAAKVQVGAMADASGRLYLVFRAIGDAGQAMSIGWRHCSGLPVSSSAVAAKGGSAESRWIGVSPYVPDGKDPITTASAVLERRFQLYDRESHEAIAGTHPFEVGAGGRVTPIFMPETSRLRWDETPPREWFLESRRTPVAELLGP